MARKAKLTERQAEVAALTWHDLGDKQIADKLGISVRTVRFHTARARRKLGVRTRAGLAAAWYARSGAALSKLVGASWAEAVGRSIE